MTTAKKDKRKVKIIARYIDENLHQTLNIAVLTELFGISDFTLKRIFKAEFNISPHKYIKLKRLKEGRKLVLATDLPIKQIAAMVGFKSVPSFSKAFSNEFHISPGAMRNR